MKFDKAVLIGINENSLSKENWKKFDALVGKRVQLAPNDPNLKKELADADCLFNGFGVDVKKDLIDAAPKLKYIGVFATAFNFVDTEYAKSKGIAVCNVAGYSSEAVAEFLFGSLLEYMRDLEGSKKLAREGVNEYNGALGSEIKGRVFGIIGMGNIGSTVAGIAQGFGADVRYWSKNKKPQMEAKGVKYENVDDLIKHSDILTLHFSHNKDTVGFMNRKRIESMKKGAILLSYISFESYDLDAVAERVSKGEISFIFENTEETPKAVFEKFAKLKNSSIYPSNAYATNEAMARRQTIFVDNVDNFLKGKPTNKVN